MAAEKYKVIVNDLDITDLIDGSSYKTGLEPVYGDSVTTMDGVEHTYVLRNRGTLSFGFNSLTAEKSAAVCTALLSLPAKVYYHCLQRHIDVYATMRLDGVSAQHLYRVNFGGAKWNEMGTITFTEL